MSKAFTRDEGEGSSTALSLPLGPPLPEGAKNYVTAEGAATLRTRLAEAQLALEQARAAAEPNRIQAAQERLDFFAGRGAAMEEVARSVTTSVDGPARFGAFVLTVDEFGEKRRVQIVGIDEADPAHGRVSWTSPLARALVGRRVGDEVRVKTPRGTSQLEILEVGYKVDDHKLR